MTVDFTVAIPTYNGQLRLSEVLETLRSQVGTEGFKWEVIVVDNNSTDNTANLVRDYQASWQESYPLRYVLETEQGAGFARRRAFLLAESSLIGFLDDDNIPSLDWVANAYNFALAHPQAGAYGSLIRGLFESTSFPENFDRIKPFLAITELGDSALLYDKKQKVLPPSAGLVVRKQAWEECVPDLVILTGRAGAKMLTGEDLEMLSYIQQSAWEIWYNPTMQIEHKIPAARLQKEYLIPFFQGIGYSRYVTRMLSVKPSERAIALLAYTINDIRKIILHLLKYGFRLETDLVAACEMQLFISSLFSPWYLWKNGYLMKAKVKSQKSEAI